MENELVPFMFRVDRKLLDKFKDVARRDRRSVTQQLITLIDSAVRDATEQQKVNAILRPVREPALQA